MATATDPAPALQLVGEPECLFKYGFHEPADPSGYDPEAFAMISVFQYVPAAKGTRVKTISVGRIRFKRLSTQDAVKHAKIIVNRLNEGTPASEIFPPCNVYSVPTGRPRGRRPKA